MKKVLFILYLFIYYKTLSEVLKNQLNNLKLNIERKNYIVNYKNYMDNYRNRKTFGLYGYYSKRRKKHSILLRKVDFLIYSLRKFQYKINKTNKSISNVVDRYYQKVWQIAG